ncbi:BhlA/UviB family holin-like peptide [Enterococcus sp.]|uniref:BhlA/UviB family holin-like peptide n=1 Tax=Enterococcus sp. TaxID=35783 RepID=UPI00290E1DBB|nr:BhlA/UviB family holin-like peptide [Enterococcus sp.]MDU5336148.1 BhlA/UviB family holin-like peptide [Enterococcus sp.]
MDEFISTFLNNPESIGFPVLFVLLLVWVMKQNNAREERYLNTIDGLTAALRQLEKIETTVNQINERIVDNG